MEERAIAAAQAEAARAVTQSAADLRRVETDLNTKLRVAETRVGEAEGRAQAALQSQLMAEAKLGRGEAKHRRTEEELIQAQRELEEA
eukprot:COSAG02_NODE_31111_length_539_cov_0.734091_1_plen_87_part_01